MPDHGAPAWYIYGAGGFGVETLDICISAMAAGKVPKRSMRFIVDGFTERDVLGYPVVELADCQKGAFVTIAVGEPAARAKLAEKVTEAGLKLCSAIAPSAVISPSATIEDGVIVAPFCSVQARAFIGRNAAVNTMAIVGHDVNVAEDAVISSMVNLGGAVRVGARAYIGMGGSVREKLTVGADSIVGMGSVVHNDVPEEVIAMGNPARVLRRNEDKTVFRKTGE
ncbi:acyl-ACP--UDP-N- acetylglucosamine O-acyltransferase [Agrobacterium tumefaciens]|nr:acyl-ACP--UDP-N- acetylglucosamine O-acyltransferase [Agrobacterium tumefaciens]